MDQTPPKRKHRTTGKKPPGGAREGAGRPEGATGVLEYGEAKAVKACRLRVPANATPEQAMLADRALERVVDVMEGRVHAFDAGHVLKAATHVRLETCGPVAQRMEHTGADGAGIEISINFAKEKP